MFERDCIDKKQALRDFLFLKLNSDMSPAASDLFIPIIIKELGELKVKEAEHE